MDEMTADSRDQTAAPRGIKPGEGPLCPPLRGAQSRVEQALLELRVGESLFIAEDGSLHRAKGAFVSQPNPEKPLITCTRLANGWELFPGIPSVNPISYVGRGGDTRKISQPILLSSGDSFNLGGPEASFTVPNRMDTDRQTSEIVASIIQSPIGKPIYIGRAYQKTLVGFSFVSRVHAVAVKEREGDDGTLSIRLYPGLPSHAASHFRTSSGESERIEGYRFAPNGSVVSLGTSLGEFTLPFPPEHEHFALHSVIMSLERGDVESARELLRTFLGKQPSVQEMMVGVNNSAESVAADRLESGIRLGLQLINNGLYEEAIQVLGRREPLIGLGYSIDDDFIVELTSLAADRVLATLGLLASKSWFKREEKRVDVGAGLIRRKLEPSNEDEKNNLMRFHQGVALLWAEELIHALQDARGRYVSRWAKVLKREIDHEGDVALFFKQNGVNLSNEWVSRYPNRVVALRLAKGVQNPEDQHAFKAALAKLPVGESLSVGRSDLQPYQNPRLNIAPTPGDPVRGIALLRLSRRAATITRSTDGHFLVKPEPAASEHSAVFAPDHSGNYVKIDPQGQQLAPGTKIFIGLFRFTLSDRSHT